MPTFLEKFGIVSLSLIGFQALRIALRILYDHYCASKLFERHVMLRKIGEWAVVTGATSGIGKAFVTELARRHINIVLISRNEKKLTSMAHGLEGAYKIKTRMLCIDFFDISHDNYKNIQQKLADLDIRILINNVGISYPYPEYFLKVPNAEERFNCIIKCNVFSVTHMCRILLPNMVNQSKGVIINIASASARIPSPLLTVYAATKAYIESFTRNLDYEYGGSGIYIMCLSPGVVSTNMSRIKRIPFFSPSPEEYVNCAIRLVGIQHEGTGYLPHSGLVNLIHMMEKCWPSGARFFFRRAMAILRNRTRPVSCDIPEEIPRQPFRQELDAELLATKKAFLLDHS